MLCKSPVSHNTSSNHHKDVTSHSLGCNIEAYPLIDFCGVIGTSHDVEQKPTGDLVPSTPIGTPEILQQYMAIEICKLTKQSKAKSNLPLKLTNRGVKWVIHVVSNDSSKSPVVCTVSEHIGQWRRCMAKAMHKKGLHNTFEIMETPVVAGIFLNWVFNIFPFVAKELIDREVVENGVDDQRTQVFPEKESTIRNLWAQVLKYHGYGVGIAIAIIFETLLAAKDSWFFL